MGGVVCASGKCLSGVDSGVWGLTLLGARRGIIQIASALPALRSFSAEWNQISGEETAAYLGTQHASRFKLRRNLLQRRVAAEI